jgi:hypothetical protein
MNTNVLAKNYGSLTPEKRFRLILAAGGRGDEAERDRLVNSGGRLTLSMHGHVPFAHAFDELALLVFIELLEEVGRYDDALNRADNQTLNSFEVDDEEEDSAKAEEKGDSEDEEEPAVSPQPELMEGCAAERLLRQRTLDLALAAGFMLRTKTDGWRLFCERMNVPPFQLWERLPGFDRLQRARALADKVAFFPEGMVRWLNTIRPEGRNEATVENLISAEKVAHELDKKFRQCVNWWGG